MEILYLFFSYIVDYNFVNIIHIHIDSTIVYFFVHIALYSKKQISHMAVPFWLDHNSRQFLCTWPIVPLHLHGCNSNNVFEIFLDIFATVNGHWEFEFTASNFLSFVFAWLYNYVRRCILTNLAKNDTTDELSVKKKCRYTLDIVNWLKNIELPLFHISLDILMNEVNQITNFMWIFLSNHKVLRLNFKCLNVDLKSNGKT